jgi:hypothetical protein
MNRIRKAWAALRGGPWIEVRGQCDGSGLVRFEYPEEITVTGNQRLEAVYEYRENGERIHRVRIQPWIPATVERFRYWLAERIEP